MSPLQQPDQIRSGKQYRTYHTRQAKQPSFVCRFVQRQVAYQLSALAIHGKEVIFPIPCRVQKPDREKSIVFLLFFSTYHSKQSALSHFCNALLC